MGEYTKLHVVPAQHPPQRHNFGGERGARLGVGQPMRVTGTGSAGYGYGLPNRDPRTRGVPSGLDSRSKYLAQYKDIE